MKAVLLIGDGDRIMAIPYEMPDDFQVQAKILLAARAIKSYEIPYEIRNILSPEKEEV